MDRSHQKRIRAGPSYQAKETLRTEIDGAIVALEEQGVDTTYAIKSSKSVKYL